MPILIIHKDHEKKIVKVDDGSNLHTALIENGYDIYSPCGGQGKCGKCSVFIMGEGSVNSCRYLIRKDTEVILPGTTEVNILESQQNNSIEVPFSPGKTVFLSARPAGVAIDIGTTTVVFYFTDLSDGSLLETRSMLNPQSKYGADVISRINFCAHDPDKLKILQQEILNAINLQLDHFLRFSGRSHHDLVKLTVSGNPTMLHLMAGADPLGIALAPYVPVFTERTILRSTDPLLKVHSEAEIILLPSVSAFVGADIVAGLASVNISGYKYILYIDIGTNGEIALITPERIFCCATAAGPAFEGANITCGSGAFAGAVSEYKNGKYHTIAGGKPSGICGSGLVDIISFLLETGMIDTDGYMENDFVAVPAGDTVTGKPLVITPADVREVQLAKSAIYSGITILLRKAGINVNDLDRIFLAGGFGNYINIAGAMRIGLLPEVAADNIVTIGNASGTGALLALKSGHFEDRINEILEKTEYTELSLDDEFPLEFAMNMHF